MLKALRRTKIPAVFATIIALNGFLNLATALLIVFRLSSRLPRMPSFLRITPVQRTSALLSIFLGLLLVFIGKGLYERRRRSWRTAIIVLALLVGNNLYRYTTPETAFFTLAIIGGLIVFRKEFHLRSDTRITYGQVVALTSVGFALCYGIVGSYLLRGEIRGIESWTDAVYYTFVTFSTLGYGDILPETPDAKVFVVSMVVVGLTSFIAASSVLLGPLMERHLKGVFRIMSKLQSLVDHVIICGYSNVSESIMDELRGRNVPFVIVEPKEELVALLRTRGQEVIAGDGTRKEILEQANVRRAMAVVAASDRDSDNILIAVTAKECRNSAPGSRCRIIVRVEDEENIKKAQDVGADEVISPSTLGGRLMAAKAVGADAAPTDGG